MKKALILLIVTICLHTPSVLANHIQPIQSLKSVLTPTIQEAITSYKNKKTTYAPYSFTTDFHNIQIKDIAKLNKENYYVIQVLVSTYEHAHNPPNITFNLTVLLTPVGHRVINIKSKEDQEARKINAFYKEAVSDIAQAFQLNLQSYKAYNTTNIPAPLRPFITKIIVELNPYISPPYKNVISPITFLKGNRGFIVFKLADGTNVKYELRMENQQWKIISKEKRPGKKMKKTLIWYM
ncbi:hypothetical protein BkAM31D_12695 [Halalkalibacter krulwichiae]|uniref:DUF3888 domain-containing protein n=2 Tax=Halalkalibacter krulwichiae TaxID=199441 RepID=A0A1X9MAZ0_9BACI|nr:DUF3888 domain-containing protein [Halalkalibacter krulwichiae]ARK30619.1 hypothetical protein BkAM31D_12695 [Halalkalibacter krulwichiae]